MNLLGKTALQKKIASAAKTNLNFCKRISPFELSVVVDANV
jgi:hypothetical protein